ncbi:hypothetical protein BYT27DRAFT_7339503 [Phlegmacium glaucopus]|nr:hypothetical protein BYT27DRAFT_7339503 [Phlegmacium glaucopus]
MTTGNASGSSTVSLRGTRISEITIVANKPLKSIELFINNRYKDITWAPSSEQKVWNTKFNPPLDLSPPHQIVLELHRKSALWGRAQHIEIGSAELVNQVTGGEGRNEWKKSYDAADITIHFMSQIYREGELFASQDSQLQPTTERINEICPRFRVLVIGKSSLIGTAFATNETNVAHGQAGVANINTEIIPTNNEYFVLHDSQGFEHGEVDNLSIVKDFIETRSAIPDVKDQIHAIWLCFVIPCADGRIVETGIEEFFKLKTKTPIIAVFTKYDLLVSRCQRAQLSSDNDARKKADAFVKNECVKPLKKAARMKFGSIAVSTEKGYEHTVSNLVELTQSLVEANFSKSIGPWVVGAIAQGVNPGVKIEGCIVIGRTNYWKGLATSARFAEKSLEACLFAIHIDIVVVWNIHNSHMHLRSKEFQALMTNLVDFTPNNAANPKKTLSAGIAMVGAIAGIVSALAGPAAPIVVPIAGCLVLAKWAYDIYQQSHDTLRRLMAYIVDLTLIMQNVFWLVSIYQVSVSRCLIMLAYRAYRESTVIAQVPEEIRKHVAGQAVHHRLDRDNALSKIEELLNRNRINTEEMFRLERDIGPIDLSGNDDISWNV